MRRILRSLTVAAVMLAGIAEARQEARTLELRVTGVAATGDVVVDRGSRDGLRAQDEVVLRPRGGSVVNGTVLRVQSRSAIVQLTPGSAPPPAGTRGEAKLPAGRFEPEPEVPLPPAGPEPAPEGAPDSGSSPEGAPLARTHAPWPERDDDWDERLPLLARVGVVHPGDRPRSVSGRVSLFGEVRESLDEERSDAFWRAGTSLFVENPFGGAGELHFDAELNHRENSVPDGTGESDSDIRFDRLSYAWGGTRFHEQRWEAGRFLQHGMPEFGVLDGVEVGAGLGERFRYGASLGWVPEPTPEQDTGDDRQVAAWYGWTADATEELSVRGGYQRTWYADSAERDLFVFRAHSLPREGWTLRATAWVSNDGERGVGGSEGLDLTQAAASAGRRFGDTGAVELGYTRQTFPGPLATQFEQQLSVPLEELRDQRVFLAGWKALNEGRRLSAEVGRWSDDDSAGIDAELGLEVPDVLLDGALGRLQLFLIQSVYSDVLGVRAGLGRSSGRAHWDLFYELSSHDQAGFSEERDELVLHRLRASRGFLSASGWAVSTYGEALLQDHDDAFIAGLMLQRSF